uniref:Major sperm protein n=1 Tax=Trichuris muris TaxID=70415 RepID=A0A5S6Q154_TRIMR
MCDHSILRKVSAEPLVWRVKTSDDRPHVKRIHLDNKANATITFYLHSSDPDRLRPYPVCGVMAPESQRYVTVKLRNFTPQLPRKEFVVVAFAVVPKHTICKTASQLWAGVNEHLLVRKTCTVQFWCEQENAEECANRFSEERTSLQTPTSHFDEEDEPDDKSNGLAS